MHLQARSSTRSAPAWAIDSVQISRTKIRNYLLGCSRLRHSAAISMILPHGYPTSKIDDFSLIKEHYKRSIAWAARRDLLRQEMEMENTKQPSTASLSQIPDKAWFYFVAGSFLPYPRWTMNVAYSSPGVCVCVCAVFNYTWIYLTTATWGPISKPCGGKNPMASHGHEWHACTKQAMGSGWTRLGLRYRTSLGTKGHDPHRGHQQDNPSISSMP